MKNKNTHIVKSWPEFFNEEIAGRKTHDLRRSTDRSFAVGDNLLLQEWNPLQKKYTGREALAEITYITDEKNVCAYSQLALKKGFCILSIKFLKLLPKKQITS